MEYIAIAKLIGPWLLAGAVSYGGIRAGLNGQKEKLKEVSGRLDVHISAYNTDSRQIVAALSRLETKVGLILNHKIKE